MPTYILIPDEHDYEPEEVVATNPGQLLGMVHGFGWNRARVFNGGDYLFTLALSPQGVWSILPGLPEVAH